MTKSIRKSAAMMAAIGIVALATFFAAHTASAQCTSIRVINTAGCNVQLCLYDNAVAAPQCFFIPNGSIGTPIALPAGFTPAGAVSSGGNRYAFSPLTGCTVCFMQITATPVPCCAEVCYDPATCVITISPCSGAVCAP
jgi:hypothetical protein